MMKKTGVFLCVLALLGAAFLTGCRKNNTVPTTDKTVVAADEVEQVKRLSAANGCEVFEGLYITDLFSFSGDYPEDGSDRETENTAAARLVNLSTVSYRYVEFTLSCGEANYTFFVSTLLPGAKITVLEKNGLPLNGGGITASAITAIEPFDEIPSVCLDVFRISYGDALLNVENIADAPVKNVCVYYKSVDENGYFGGITYKVAAGDIPAGEKKSLVADKLTAENSRIVFVTYEH